MLEQSFLSERVVLARAAFSAILILLTASCLKTPSPAAIEADLVIQNVTVIDARRGARTGRDVLLEGNKIASIVSSSPSGSHNGVRVIDGTGKYLIPGLWDAHVHLTYTEGLGHEVFFPLAIAHGVTSLRDTGGHLEKLLPAMEAAASDPISPDLFISGPLIDGPLRVYAGQSPLNPDISVGVASPQEAEEMVDALADAGVDFIKAYEMLSPRTYVALVKRAEARGLPVAAHAPLSMTATDAALSGADDFQHLRNLEFSCSNSSESLRDERRQMINENETNDPAELRRQIHRAQRGRVVSDLEATSCDSLIEILARSGTSQTPTLTVTRFLSHGLFGQEQYTASFDLVPSEIADNWREVSKRFAIPSDDAAVQKFDTWVTSMLPRLADAGVPIMAGTDAPIGFLTPGVSLHFELFLLVDAGLTPLQALEAATLTPAEFFGLETQVGSIEPGFMADLVLLNEDPLIDIRNVSSIEAVVKNGRFIDREELDVLLAAPSK